MNPVLAPCRWIVGVDGSPTSHHALRWALAHHTQHGAAVTALGSWQPLEGSPDDPRPEDELRRVVRNLERLRDEIGTEAADLQIVARRGEPVSVVLEQARAADLVILGTHGRGRFQSLVLGSVSRQVASQAPVPVVVVPPSAQLDGSFDRMVVGIDGSTNSLAALSWTLGFAGRSTTIDVLVAGDSSTSSAGERAYGRTDRSPDHHQGLRRSIDDVIAAEAPMACTVSIVFEQSRAVDALVRRSRTSDLVVVGARGRGAIASTVLGSVSDAVLVRSSCPVVVVPGS